MGTYRRTHISAAIVGVVSAVICLFPDYGSCVQSFAGLKVYTCGMNGFASVTSTCSLVAPNVYSCAASNISVGEWYRFEDTGSTGHYIGRSGENSQDMIDHLLIGQ